jgi:glycerol-3-phosphate dehydrogenase
MNNLNKLRELRWEVQRLEEDIERTIQINTTGIWNDKIKRSNARIQGIYQAVNILGLRDEFDQTC